jgi:hypothetical protein
MRRTRRLLPTLALLALTSVGVPLAAAGCSDDPLSADTDAPSVVELEGVRVQADRLNVTIYNGRAYGIHYFIFDWELMAVVEPCWSGDPALCPHLWAGATLTVPRSEVFVSEASEYGLLQWWHMLPAGDGGPRMDSLRSMKFRLP